MSKQQTLLHHFASGAKNSRPRKENGNVTFQAARGQDNGTESFDDDDLLLAACQDWEETTLIHPANENSTDGTSQQNQAPRFAPGNTGLPSLQSLQNQGVPRATQLEDLPGFDTSTGKIWIYPTNLPVRDYQYNIVKQALFKNTMVSLPTGLGKTFVAAVVMYNFFRWYPEGRVVFMAPTKPLVAQQIEACHNVMGIRQSDMAEMTGNMPPAERKKAWDKCRVFFLTPQVLMNDLSRRACPTQLIKCLVVDEAHKALGNHSYCQVVRELYKYSSQFRVLALSATPGSDLKAIQQVLNNLLISHIEIRSEDSIDIQRYIHKRKVEKVVVPLDKELKSVRDQYLRILSGYVGRLTRCGCLYNKDPASLTKFQILQSRDAFRQDPPPQVKSRGVVEGEFALCISLYHGFELLLQHGLRSLYSFLNSTVDNDRGFSRTRQKLLHNPKFVQLLDTLRDKFGGGDQMDGSANRSGLFSGPGTPKVKEVKPYVTSHPKMAKLQEIVLEHFRQFSANKGSPSIDMPSTSKQPPQPAVPQSTRVMIFAQYRDSVNEIAEMLNRHRPLLRCMGFVGQASAGKNSKGISQKEQLRVVKAFREGGYNTLVCTCVGEEGLDIGDVDLIVCYDAHKSPIRLVQRMGRTGRKRQGRIVMLVTEGKEAAIYDRSQYSKKGIIKALQGNARSLQLYPNNPRMVPCGLNPAPHQMFITVKAFKSKEAKQRSTLGAGSETRIDSFVNKAKNSKKSSEFLSPEELAYWSTNYKLDAAEKASLPSYPDRGCFITLGDKNKQPSRRRKSSCSEISLSEWSPWQMSKQPVHLVEHSQRCHQFVELMEFIDLQNMTEGEDIYGLEMQTYLDEEDIIRLRKKGIKNYCTKLAKDTSDDGDHLNKANMSRQQEPFLLDTEEETPRGSIGKNSERKKAKRKNRPMELMSSSSEGDHSDGDLPDVFHEEDANLVPSEIPECSTMPTGVRANGRLSDTRGKKEKASESKTCNLQDVRQDDDVIMVLPAAPEHSKTPANAEKVEMTSGLRSEEKASESKSSKTDKPRKLKQKRKHLRHVFESSDGDEDFISDLRQTRACEDGKIVSLEQEQKATSPEGDPALHNANGSPNQKGMDGKYNTPEPMDTDSDDFQIFKIQQKMSEALPGKGLSGSGLNELENDLSMLFPSQSTFFPFSSKKDCLKPNVIKRDVGKSGIPPPPPSLSSLDLLDDTDTTFDVTQHFENETYYFGGQREAPHQPSDSPSCEESPKVRGTSLAENLQEFQVDKPKRYSQEKAVFGTTEDTGNNGTACDEQSKDFSNRSPPDGLENIPINNSHNDELKKKQLESLNENEPQFDLKVDFTLLSSDEEVEIIEEENLQEFQVEEPKCYSKEKAVFGTTEDTGNNGTACDEQSKDFSNRSPPDGLEKIQVSNSHNDELKKKQLNSLQENEPQFDLEVDFTLFSSDEVVEIIEEEKPKTGKGSSIEEPPNQDDNVGKSDLGYLIDDNLESVVGTPQAFDVETPIVESTLTETNIASTQKALEYPNVHVLQKLCDIAKEDSEKSLQSWISKRPPSATPETSKSGLIAKTKTSFAGRLQGDWPERQSCAKNESGFKRELDLKIQDSPEILPPKMPVDTGQVRQEEDPAETEKLRMEVLGSAEPKFDLGFDLDSLEEDDSGEEDDIVASSPNIEPQQKYINLGQCSIPRGQLSRFQTRISSTPASKPHSLQNLVPCTNFLSPIATDMKPLPEPCPDFDANPQNLRANESELLQTTPIKEKAIESVRRPEQSRKSLSLGRKSPQNFGTVKEGKVSSPFTSLDKKNVTQDALPRPIRGPCEANIGPNSHVRPTVLGKRKSAPVTNLADDSPIEVKRQKSELVKTLPPQSVVHVPAHPETGVFSLKEAGAWQGCRTEMEISEEKEITLDEEDEKEVEDLIKEDHGRKNNDPIGHPLVDSDENEELSQPIQHRKRRKAIALQSPMTPAFKTPVRPTADGSSKKTTHTKPLVFSSDDDGESPLIRRPKTRRQIVMTADADETDEDFMEVTSCRKDPTVVKGKAFSKKRQHMAGKNLQMNTKQKQTKKGRLASSDARDFLEEDVHVSDAEEYSSDEEGSDLDNSLEGFINNDSQLTQASQSELREEDMHAVYMQSVRSPAGGGVLHPYRNRFKMVQQPDPDDLEIYSQVPVQDESYYENSFVVREGEGEERGTGMRNRGESLFEITINPDNILSANRRRRNRGPSRAEQILKEGRRKVLMSSSSTSTEETEEEQRGLKKVIQSRDRGNGQKVFGIGTTHSVELESRRWKNPDSSGWLSTNKSIKQKSSSLAGPRREHVTQPQGSPKKGSHVLHSARDSVRTDTVDNDKCHAIRGQHKQYGIEQQSNPCPPRSSVKTAEVAENRLTLAEKERAERLRRQEEKKREFMRKIEEKKREQQQQKQSQEQAQQHAAQSQQQRDLKPFIEQVAQQSQQIQQVTKQHQHVNAHQQKKLQHQQQVSVTQISAGRSSHSAGSGVGQVPVKKMQQAKSSFLEQQQKQQSQHLQQLKQQQQRQHWQQKQQQQEQQHLQQQHLQQQHLQQQQQKQLQHRQQIQQQQHVQQKQQQWQQQQQYQQQPHLEKQLHVQQQKAEIHVCAGRSSHSARPSSGEVRVKKIHPQAQSRTWEPQTPLSTYSSPAASAASGTCGIPAPTTKGSGCPTVSPTSGRIISRTTLAGSQEAISRGKPVIMIDSKELSSSSHIVSTLALKHNLNPIVNQLTGCDYIVSARMGVEKRSMTDFGNGANKNKLIDRVRHLCELFDRPCLILEKDRIKPGDEKKPRQLIRTRYFDSTLAVLSKTHIKVLYSDSVEDTARILADLVRMEVRKGEGLAPPTSMGPTQEQVFKFYQSLPRVSYVTAWSLIRAFPSVQQLINSSSHQVKEAAHISHQRSAEICCFLQRQFNEQMVRLSSGK